MPAKLPEPVVGTEAQAGPNGPSIIAALAEAAAAGAAVAAVVGAVVAPALEHAPTKVTLAAKATHSPLDTSDMMFFR